MTRDIGGLWAHCVAVLAHIAMAEGQAVQAARLCGAADRNFGRVLQSVHDATLATARTALGDAAFARAWAEGHAMSPERTLAVVMAEARRQSP